MRSEREADRAVELYADTVRRICLVHLKSYADTEDIFQTVFLKYILSSVAFESEEHEKAWFIRVTINACKDFWKGLLRRRTVPLEDVPPQAEARTVGRSEVLNAVLVLPAKYRDAIYLFYYEGYSAVEIGRLLGKNVNTVYTYLARARGLLRERLGGGDDA